MQIRESDLPGIGKKFVIETRSKDKLVVIVHDNGKREVYYFNHADPDESIPVGTLEDDEARAVAGILGGITYKPKALETIDVEIDDLVIEWLKVENASSWVGKSIGELQVRQLTGVSIIAVVEKEKKHVSPGPNYIFAPDSVVVIAGERQHIKLFKELMNASKGE
jgi:TrkA domain protein